MRLNRTAVFAFFAVYVVWGSTYLAIRYGIETIPAWTLTTSRFLVAAAIMALLSLVRREAPLSPQERNVAWISGILMVAANGIVCVVEYWVASGIVAVVIGAMPIWMMLLGWASFGQGRPTFLRMLGAVIGLFGVGLIAFGTAAPIHFEGAARFGILFLIISGLLWAGGTLLQRRVVGLKSIFRFSAIQMFGGALVAGVVSLVFENSWITTFSNASANSLWALAYLTVFGSVIAFTAYAWLSRNVEPHLVSTYALVNPVIAVCLGWLFFQEAVTTEFILASALVLVGLYLLMRTPPRKV